MSKLKYRAGDIFTCIKSFPPCFTKSRRYEMYRIDTIKRHQCYQFFDDEGNEHQFDSSKSIEKAFKLIEWNTPILNASGKE